MIKNKISNKCESQEYSCWKMQFKTCKALEQRKYSLQNCSSQFSRCFNENKSQIRTYMRPFCIFCCVGCIDIVQLLLLKLNSCLICFCCCWCYCGCCFASKIHLFVGEIQAEKNHHQDKYIFSYMTITTLTWTRPAVSMIQTTNESNRVSNESEHATNYLNDYSTFLTIHISLLIDRWTKDQDGGTLTTVVPVTKLVKGTHVAVLLERQGFIFPRVILNMF